MPLYIKSAIQINIALKYSNSRLHIFTTAQQHEMEVFYMSSASC